MTKKTYILGIISTVLIALYSCNHPRTENEQPRMPEDRELTPLDGAPSTTDTAHNDTMRNVDSMHLHNPDRPTF